MQQQPHMSLFRKFFSGEYGIHLLYFNQRSSTVACEQKTLTQTSSTLRGVRRYSIESQTDYYTL